MTQKILVAMPAEKIPEGRKTVAYSIKSPSTDFYSREPAAEAMRSYLQGKGNAIFLLSIHADDDMPELIEYCLTEPLRRGIPNVLLDKVKLPSRKKYPFPGEARNIVSGHLQRHIPKGKGYRIVVRNAAHTPLVYYSHNPEEHAVVKVVTRRLGRALLLPFDPDKFTEGDIKRLVKLHNALRKSMPDKKVFDHSPNYRSAILDGIPYTFTTKQAAVVKILHEHWKRRLPELSQQYILTEVESDLLRLKDLFKGNDAWGILIIKGTHRDTYRLNI